MQSRYQLIHPFVSERIYEKRDPKHAAKKCYQELLNNHMKTSDFIVMNLDTNEKHHYARVKTNHKKQHSDLDQNQIIDLNQNEMNMNLDQTNLIGGKCLFKPLLPHTKSMTGGMIQSDEPKQEEITINQMKKKMENMETDINILKNQIVNITKQIGPNANQLQTPNPMNPMMEFKELHTYDSNPLGFKGPHDHLSNPKKPKFVKINDAEMNESDSCVIM